MSKDKDKKFDLHFLEGVKRFESGKFAESLEEFFNAAQIDPSSSSLHYYIGEALERHKQQLIDGQPPAATSNRTTNTNQRTTKGGQRATQAVEVEASEQFPSPRSARRYQSRIPVIMVAYDANGKFFAELAMTSVTSVKGAAIEMQRCLAPGAQVMIFTIDSSNAVPARVRNVHLDTNRSRYKVGVEFLKGPVDWLVPESPV